LNPSNSSSPVSAALIRCNVITLSNKIQNGSMCRFLQRQVELFISFSSGEGQMSNVVF
jgi:hypothetical protein